VLGACAPATTGSTSGGATTQQSQPFDLRVGLGVLISTMDPHASIGNNSRRYGLYEALVAQDENGKLEAGLATSWRNVDPNSWEFKLAQGRKWHDGTPVTVEDVKFSYDRTLAPQTPPLGIVARLGKINGARIVDPQTVVITTSAPDPLLLKRAALIVIVQKAHVEKVGNAGFTTQAMGTGPYKQVSYSLNDRLVLEQSEHSAVKGNARTVTIRQIPELSTRVAGLQSGDLDLIQGVTVDRAETLRNDGYPIVNFNQGRSTGAKVFSTFDGPTKHKEVRQALNYAVDKELIARQIFKGFTRPEQGQVLQPTSVGFNNSLRPYAFDTARARTLLAQAGYPNGFKLTIDLYATSADLEPMWILIQSQFRAAGIEADINKFADSATFLDKWYARSGRNAILTVSLLNSPAMDADFALTWFSGAITGPDKRYANPAFDAAYSASLVELDEAKRASLLQQAVQVMHEDPPYLFLVEGFDLWASAKNLTDVKSRGDQEPRFDIIKKR
jgi:peptide/nickel transport system substrate-binding protein